MTLTFYTNFINHHQVPLADEFYKLLGPDYTFVAREPIPNSFKKKGYRDYSDRPYLLESYRSEKDYDLAMRLANESDVVILGDAPEFIIEERLRNNKITFHYNERWFKNINRQLLKPKTWFNWYNSHTKYRNKQSYMLSAGAYVKRDCSLLFAYPGKCYKWGYFTEVKELDVDIVLSAKRNNPLKILWCGSIEKLKHPEFVVLLARYLANRKLDFHISMIGMGAMRDRVLEMAMSHKVIDRISFVGNVPNEHVLEMMRSHHVFIFTSNRQEGWGAVLNEAMSNLCTVVCSHMVGAAPFLIKNNHNGLLFRSEDVDSLCREVETLLLDREKCEKLARTAYEDMLTIWSPQVAVENFLQLISSLQNGENYPIVVGPCSKAECIRNRNLFDK